MFLKATLLLGLDLHSAATFSRLSLVGATPMPCGQLALGVAATILSISVGELALGDGLHDAADDVVDRAVLVDAHGCR